MNVTRILVVLSVLNLGLLATQLIQMRPAHAQNQPGMVRATGFELVDSAGRVRVQMKLEPGNPDFEWPDGKVGYPETVIFRLITADGKPRVKITTSDEGSGVSLVGVSDGTHTILKSDGSVSSLKLLNEDGAEEIIEP